MANWLLETGLYLLGIVLIPLLGIVLIPVVGLALVCWGLWGDRRRVAAAM